MNQFKNRSDATCWQLLVLAGGKAGVVDPVCSADAGIDDFRGRTKDLDVEEARKQAEYEELMTLLQSKDKKAELELPPMKKDLPGDGSN